MRFADATEAFDYAGSVAEIFDSIDLGGMSLRPVSNWPGDGWRVEVYHCNDLVRTVGGGDE